MHLISQTVDDGLKTMSIVNSISKSGNLLSLRGQMAGKRLRDDPGGWWLSERDL